MHRQALALTEIARLEARLRRARERLAAAPPFSPDWDAAMAETEAIERQLPGLRPVPVPRPTPPRVTGPAL